MNIINVKVANIRPKYNNLKEWIDDTEKNTYIGRAGIVFIDGERYPKVSSIWANPFKIGKYSREECLIKYESYITDKINNDNNLLNELLQLKGKQLGCWCHPEQCHGDILIKLIKQYDLQ